MTNLINSLRLVGEPCVISLICGSWMIYGVRILTTGFVLLLYGTCDAWRRKKIYIIEAINYLEKFSMFTTIFAQNDLLKSRIVKMLHNK